MNQLPNNRPIVQKENRWRNRAYLNYVKSLPCIFPGCGVYGCDPHHIKGVGHMSGAGLTAPDYAAMPLCREHHTLVQGDSEYWPMQWEWACRTLGRAVEEGILR